MKTSARKQDRGTATTAPAKLRYELVPIGLLKPNPNNARIHSKRQLRELCRSFREYNVLSPVIAAPDMTIIAGHGRYQAAQQLGLTTLPVLVADGLSPAQLRAYAIADNKLGDMSSFDGELLLKEIEAIVEVDCEFDVTLTGFVTAEIDMLFGTARTAALNDLDDDLPTVLPRKSVSRTGDCWVLGDHRLVCGDATDPAVMRQLLADEEVQLVLSDVPFNTKIKGMVSGLGRNVHEDFAMASGEMSRSQFVEFLAQSFDTYASQLRDGAMVLLFIDWRHVAEMLEAGAKSGLELKNILVWAKDNAGMGSLWRSQHELICAFKHGTAPHVNNVELGVHGRYRSNVLRYPGMNSPGRGRGKALELHATVKPVALIADLMLDVSDRNAIVLDPFGGSGTAIIAAERVQRRARLIEIEPKFVDVAVERWQRLAGRNAVHADGGATFAEISKARLQSPAGEAADD